MVDGKANLQIDPADNKYGSMEESMGVWEYGSMGVWVYKLLTLVDIK